MTTSTTQADDFSSILLTGKNKINAERITFDADELKMIAEIPTDVHLESNMKKVLADITHAFDTDQKDSKTDGIGMEEQKHDTIHN